MTYKVVRNTSLFKCINIQCWLGLATSGQECIRCEAFAIDRRRANVLVDEAGPKEFEIPDLPSARFVTVGTGISLRLADVEYLRSVLYALDRQRATLFARAPEPDVTDEPKPDLYLAGTHLPDIMPDDAAGVEERKFVDDLNSTLVTSTVEWSLDDIPKD